MRNRILLSLAGMAGLLVLAGFGRCCPHPQNPSEVAAFVTDRVDDALDDLNATDAQRAQVHALKDRLLSKGLELRKEGEPIRAEVLAQWQSATPDRARLHALVDERIEAIRALAHEAVDAGVELHDVLTPEQRAKLTKKIERMHGVHP